MVDALVGCSEYAPRLNVNHELVSIEAYHSLTHVRLRVAHPRENVGFSTTISWSRRVTNGICLCQERSDQRPHFAGTSTTVAFHLVSVEMLLEIGTIAGHRKSDYTFFWAQQLDGVY